MYASGWVCIKWMFGILYTRNRQKLKRKLNNYVSMNFHNRNERPGIRTDSKKKDCLKCTPANGLRCDWQTRIGDLIGVACSCCDTNLNAWPVTPTWIATIHYDCVCSCVFFSVVDYIEKSGRYSALGQMNLNITSAKGWRTICQAHMNSIVFVCVIVMIRSMVIAKMFGSSAATIFRWSMMCNAFDESWVLPITSRLNLIF